MKKLFIKLKRLYHRWRLNNACLRHSMKICAYHASTNSYTVRSKITGNLYHLYVNADGKVKFEGR